MSYDGSGTRSYSRIWTPNAAYLVEEGEKPEDEPEQLQDKPKDQCEKLDQINIVAQGEEPRPVFISANFLIERESNLCSC